MQKVSLFNNHHFDRFRNFNQKVLFLHKIFIDLLINH
jgi:hypothetical protein